MMTKAKVVIKMTRPPKKLHAGHHVGQGEHQVVHLHFLTVQAFAKLGLVQ